MEFFSYFIKFRNKICISLSQHNILTVKCDLSENVGRVLELIVSDSVQFSL